MKNIKVLSSYEFMREFSTDKKCLDYLMKTRWGNGIECPDCESKRVASRKFPYFRCKDCRLDFTPRTNTIFHRSKIPLGKWFYAIYLLQTARKGVSSLQLSKQIGVTQKTAWFMSHRIREACKVTSPKFNGIVESDETYFGGKNIYRHKNKIKKGKAWQSQKVAVQGLKLGNEVKTNIINSVSKKSLIGNIVKHVEAGSHIITDENYSYRGLNKLYHHSKVYHGMRNYVSGGLSTNGIESVWAVMKRGYKGVYHHWSRKHIHRYLDEFTFRLDKGNCKHNTMARVNSLIENSFNKRLTYKELIG